MRNVRLFFVAVTLGLIVVGCKKNNSVTTNSVTEGKDQIRKEAAMGISLQWLGHASFKISDEDTVIYIDPWKLKGSPKNATLVLVSHSHYDHYSQEDIAKVASENTTLVASADVAAKEKAGQAIMPGQTIEIDSVRVSAVAAYNPKKQFHPKSNRWLGFIIEVGSKRIYYAGDTDLTDEMKSVKDIDVALLPVGGTYTMNASDAAEAIGHIKPKNAIPYHWGDIVGGRADADAFSRAADCDVKIVSPGETINLD